MITNLEDCARRTISFAAAELADVEGIKAPFAPSNSADQVFTAADYDGPAVALAGTIWAKVPRQVTITRFTSPGDYNLNPVTITGKVNGELIVELLVPQNVNGGDEMDSLYIWDLPPQITIPQQPNVNGSIEIGVQDIGPPAFTESYMGFKLHANGTMNIHFGGQPDAIPCVADIRERVRVDRVLTSPLLTSPTSVGLTLYAL